MSQDKEGGVSLPELVYVVPRVQPWSALSMSGIEISLSGDPAIGFLLVYKSREDAEKEWPGAEVMEFTKPTPSPRTP